jgi:hypothetical protein
MGCYAADTAAEVYRDPEAAAAKYGRDGNPKP